MPGRYVPDSRGLHELALTPDVQAAVLDAAQRGARAAAGVDARGNYVAASATVTAGRRNELRAGATVTDEGSDSMEREAKSHALSRTAVAAIESGNR